MRTNKKHLELTLVLTAIAVGASNPAMANAWFNFGFDGQSIARGNATVASATGVPAVYYNPAGLIREKKRFGSFTYLQTLPRLEYSATSDPKIASVEALPAEDATTVCAPLKDTQNEFDKCNEMLRVYNKYRIAARHNLELDSVLADRAANPRALGGATIGADIPLDLKPERAIAAVGAAAFMPVGPIAYQRLKSPSVPYFLDYDDSPHRLVIAAGGAIDVASLIEASTDSKVPFGIRVGGGAEVLVDISASMEPTVVIPPKLELLSLTPNFQDIRFTADGTVEIPPTAAPIAGIQIAPVEWLEFGAAFRDEQNVNIDVSGTLDIRTPIRSAISQIPINMAASGAFTPRQISGGLTVRPPFLEGLSLSGEAAWQRWSTYQPPFSVSLAVSGIKATATDVCRSIDGLDSIEDIIGQFIEIPEGDTVCGVVDDFIPEEFDVETYKPKQKLDDIIVTRVGASYALATSYEVSAGYSYQPSPVPDQTGIYNILDADTQEISGGFFYTLVDPGITFGIYGQYKMLASSTVKKCLSAVAPTGCSKLNDTISDNDNESDVMPDTTVDPIPNAGNNARIASVNANIEKLNDAIVNQQPAIPGYPSYTLGGGYLTLGLQLSASF